MAENNVDGSGENLKDLAAKSLRWIREHAPANLEAEIYLSRTQERGLEMRLGQQESLQHYTSEGAGLRILRDSRMGFASTGSLNIDDIKILYHKVLAQLDHLEPDPGRAFPNPGAPTIDGAAAPLADSLWDEGLFSESWENISAKLKKMEQTTLAADKKITSVLRLGYDESRGEIAIANSLGVLITEKGSTASVGIAAIAEESGERQVGSAMTHVRHSRNLDWEGAARNCAWRAAALVAGRKIASAERAVIFDPWVSGEFLDLISDLLCADQIQRGKSLLAGKLGKKVGSTLVSFLDDPRRLGGMSSSLYDDEGCPTKAKTLIDQGIVREYFYDTYTGKKDSRPGNASAGRGSYRGLPSPGSSNFYLAPGKESRESIIAGTQDGILVLEVMGMHTVDPTSGEFSVAVSGLAVENGQLTHPVKSAMIAGNLLDLLDRVDAVGNDLTFYGGIGSPTFRIGRLSVA